MIKRYPKGTSRGGQFAPKQITATGTAAKMEKLKRKATAVRIRAYKIRKRLDKMDKNDPNYKALASKHNALVASYKKMNSALKKQPMKQKGKTVQSKKQRTPDETLDNAIQLKQDTLYLKKMSRMFPQFMDEYADDDISAAAKAIGITPDEYKKLSYTLRTEYKKNASESNSAENNVMALVDNGEFNNYYGRQKVQDLYEMKEPKISNAGAMWAAKRIVDKGYDPFAARKTEAVVKKIESEMKNIFTPNSMRSNKSAIGLDRAITAFYQTTGEFADSNSKYKRWSDNVRLRNEFIDVIDGTGGDMNKILRSARDWYDIENI